jgi:hypothetical protein
VAGPDDAGCEAAGSVDVAVDGAIAAGDGALSGGVTAPLEQAASRMVRAGATARLRIGVMASWSPGSVTAA